MVNIKKKDFFDVITGEQVSGEYYGIDAAVFKKVDNIDMVFDSRGKYLGIRVCQGKIINDKGKIYYTGKKGIRDYRSISDLSIWACRPCSNIDFIETSEGVSAQIRQ